MPTAALSCVPTIPKPSLDLLGDRRLLRAGITQVKGKSVDAVLGELHPSHSSPNLGMATSSQHVS